MELPHFLWGITVGVWLTIGIHTIRFENKVKAYDKAIDECELHLTRSQHCVITAIPEEINNEG